MEHKTAVILAAGLGTRLQARQRIPKPLVMLSGKPMLVRTLDTLAEGGLRRAVVVVGYQADLIRTTLDEYARPGFQVETVFNPDYTKSNGVSLLAARPAVPDRFILTMSDHLLDSRIVTLALQADPKDGAALCVDFKLDTIFDMDDATKVLTQDHHILRIGKELVHFNAVDTGVFHCSMALIEALQSHYEITGDCSLSDGMRALAAQRKARTVDIGAFTWQDVDTGQMLHEAERKLRLSRASQGAVADRLCQRQTVPIVLD